MNEQITNNEQINEWINKHNELINKSKNKWMKECMN